MPNTISIHEYKVPRQVFRPGPVRAHEFFLEFSVTVEQHGCYAIAVSLRDEDDVTGDDAFASNTDVELLCHCFQPGVAQRFYITGGESAPEGAAPPQPQAGATRLSGVTGIWPDSDGPFDDTLEVRADIELFACSFGECGVAVGRPCGRLDWERPRTVVHQVSTRVKKVDVGNGTGIEEGVDLLKEAGGAAAGAAMGARVRPVEPRDRLLAALLKRVRRLERVRTVVQVEEPPLG
jgi:hypothetical protein